MQAMELVASISRQQRVRDCQGPMIALARFARENLLPAVVDLTRIATNYFRALGRREATERDQMPANGETQLKIAR